MLKLFGTFVSDHSLVSSQVHTHIEFIASVAWITLTLKGHPVEGAIVWYIGLQAEHILALAAGKIA